MTVLRLTDIDYSVLINRSMCKVVSKNINVLGESQVGTLFIIESGIKRVGAIFSFCLEDSRIFTSQNKIRWP